MRVLFVAAFLIVSACSPPPRGYQPGVQANFMRACESQSTVRGLCACAWGKIEANVAPADFAALETMSGPQRDASPVKQQIDGYTRACLADLQREPQPAP